MKNINNMEEQLVTVTEVSKITTFSRTSIHNYINDKSNDFPRPTKFFGKTLWRKSDVVAWIESKFEGGNK